MPQVFRVGSYWVYKCLLANNNSDIPSVALRNIMRIIEARSIEVVNKWYSFYGEIEYYC